MTGDFLLSEKDPALTFYVFQYIAKDEERSACPLPNPHNKHTDTGTRNKIKEDNILEK